MLDHFLIYDRFHCFGVDIDYYVCGDCVKLIHVDVFSEVDFND